MYFLAVILTISGLVRNDNPSLSFSTSAMIAVTCLASSWTLESFVPFIFFLPLETEHPLDWEHPASSPLTSFPPFLASEGLDSFWITLIIEKVGTGGFVTALKDWSNLYPFLTAT